MTIKKQQTGEPQDRHISETGQEDAGADGGQTPEIGGVKGPEPTRFGDWEKNGRCIDF
ncbi:succinate dehydrogenase assembly factor 4 [Methylomarinum sp. Ch1-1]|uniref:Succinate dehydrogenase assembly factor 4 n=1 Tax=Methylomarinum roseum TaxID=3067653 RepID=A0AAU7NQM8_9GAMM